uniref:NICE-3 protein n=1 Tax=Siphoviridae sp. ctDXA22 TaxID=2826198 RepID=A0A8S5NPC6_9CAUD|nr:MAG TPA: NICE-3 protein [Siphoviridae sp. ctDXA22]
MKSVLPFVTERFENKEISTEQYSEFMNRYKELEGRYGIYD